MRKLLFIFRNTPYSSLITQEGIELLLLSSSYGQDLSVLLLGNAVLQLIKEQHPEKILRKNIGKMFSALPLYEIKNIYVEKRALEQYRLDPANLLIDCQIVNQQQIKAIIHNQQGIINC